jgi:hypothetical protein
MRILNMFYSLTGNTEKVAKQVEETCRKTGHTVDTVRIVTEDAEVDVTEYDFVFEGSGVYRQLPGKPLMTCHKKLLTNYVKSGVVKPGSPRRSSQKAVVYCTYGGAHTGINEAIPAVKYMGQLYDHLGFVLAGEWYVVGEYLTEALSGYSKSGRLGDITGRPNQHDLMEVGERVKGVLRM